LSKAFHSSGDVIADRRAGYAKMLAEGGDHVAAADLMSQALDLAPDWAAGWDLLGGYHDKAGNVAGAISAWRHLEALDDEGVFGARLKLAVHGAGAIGEGTAVSYVEALFDQYATQFENSLVNKLEYQVPDLLNALLEQEAARFGIARFDVGGGGGGGGHSTSAAVPGSWGSGCAIGSTISKASIFPPR
jgi:predicted TPR repeat methyltransferase